MYGHAADGFRDLRVVDADGTQVPWRTEPLPDAVAPRAVALVARGELDGVVSVVLDRGATAGCHRPDRARGAGSRVRRRGRGSRQLDGRRGLVCSPVRDADLCRPWSRRRSQHDGALSVHGLPLPPRPRSRRLPDRRSDGLPRSAPASSRSRRRSVELASTTPCDRRDAGSRFPQRPRRRGRGAVEHRHVRATCRRGGIERRHDVRPVGRCGGRALPRCKPRSNPGRRSPALRSGHDPERRRRSTLGASRAGVGTRPAARPRRGLHAAVSASLRSAWPDRTGVRLRPVARGRDRPGSSTRGGSSAQRHSTQTSRLRPTRARSSRGTRTSSTGCSSSQRSSSAVGGFLALRRRA